MKKAAKEIFKRYGSSAVQLKLKKVSKRSIAEICGLPKEKSLVGWTRPNWKGNFKYHKSGYPETITAYQIFRNNGIFVKLKEKSVRVRITIEEIK